MLERFSKATAILLVLVLVALAPAQPRDKGGQQLQGGNQGAGPSQENDQAANPGPTAVVPPRPKTADQKDKDAKPVDDTPANKVIAGCTIVIALATLVQLGIAVWAANIAKGQRDSMNLALTETQRANDLARQAIETSERPWLTFGFPDVNPKLYSNMEFRSARIVSPIVVNGGKSPAILKATSRELVVSATPPVFTEVKPRLFDTPSSGIVAPGATVGVYGMRLPEENPPADMSAYLVCSVRYADIFGKEYETVGIWVAASHMNEFAQTHVDGFNSFT